MSAEQEIRGSERDYLERTIATVRNHRDADNCWPQWANIFADEIERLWALAARLVAERGDALHLLADAQRGRKAAQHEAFKRGDRLATLREALEHASVRLGDLTRPPFTEYHHAVAIVRDEVRAALAAAVPPADETAPGGACAPPSGGEASSPTDTETGR